LIDTEVKIISERPNDCPKITAIICTLNEEQNLPHVLPQIPVWIDEILLIDGHSEDNTVAMVKKLYPRVRVLAQPGKGKGDAIKYGVLEATGDIIVTLDADGQNDPKDIQKFITPLLKGFDLAKGTRLSRGRPKNMPRYRWFGNKILAFTSNILYGTRYSDVCSGYNAFKRRAFQSLKLTNDGFAMEQEMMVKAKKAGLKVTEVEHYDAGRLACYSKVSGIKQGFIDLWLIVRERF